MQIEPIAKETEENVLVTPNRRMVNPLLQGTLKMRHTLRTTPKPHFLAEIVPSLPTNRALSTWNSHFESHTVTDLEAIHLRPNTDDHTRGFVTQGEGSTSAEVTIGEFLVVGDIRTADACRFYLDLEFACKWFLNGSCFLRGTRLEVRFELGSRRQPTKRRSRGPCSTDAV